MNGRDGVSSKKKRIVKKSSLILTREDVLRALHQFLLHSEPVEFELSGCVSTEQDTDGTLLLRCSNVLIVRKLLRYKPSADRTDAEKH